MTATVQIQLPTRHPNQLYIDQRSARWNIMRCGRRFGKDVLNERRFIRRSAILPYQAWCAPTYRMMEQNFASILKRVQPIVRRSSKDDHTIELVNGSTMDFFSLEAYETMRGRKYNWVTINEAAQFKKLEDAWNAVVRATLADYRGGADLGSTPRGHNYFKELEQQFKLDPQGRVFHFTSYDNPYIDKAEVDAMIAVMPKQISDQELLAQYVQGGTFFENIENVCVIDQPDDPANHCVEADGVKHWHQFVAGLDWAKSGDFSSLTIGCIECGKTVDWWRGNGISFIQQRSIIEQTLSRWPNVRLLPERNSIGEPNIEMLVADGLNIEAGPDQKLGYYTTTVSKVDLITRAHLILAKGEFLLPKEYLDEYLSYEMEITSTNPRFNAPEGKHDDTVISGALMLRVAAIPIQIFI